jgi:hypothetical protein
LLKQLENKTIVQGQAKQLIMILSGGPFGYLELQLTVHEYKLEASIHLLTEYLKGRLESFSTSHASRQTMTSTIRKEIRTQMV